MTAAWPDYTQKGGILMKRLLSLVLSLALLLAVYAPAIAENASDYPDVDLSTPETITMYHVGNDLTDWMSVSAKVNELLQQKINTTVDFVHISFADFIANYTLYCASPDIDIIYTADWCNYGENARAGAFKALDDTFLKTYMSKTYEAMPASAWAEIKINNTIYTVPRDYSEVVVPSLILTRQSWLDKVGFKAEDITSWDKLDEFMYAIAESEKGTGVYPINCQGFWPSHHCLLNPKYNLGQAGSSSTGIWYFYDLKKDPAAMEDLVWFGDTPEFKDYCLKMAEYYKKGVYPSDVISNESTLEDNFTAGTSIINFSGISLTMTYMTQFDDLVPLYITMDDTTRTYRDRYMRYGNSFPYLSNKTERAAVALDMMMNDPEINMLLVYGFEGEHYILNDDGTYSNGPANDRYTTDQMIFSMQRLGNPALKVENETLAAWKKTAEERVNDSLPTIGFSYDSSKYAAEASVISALWTEYQWTLGFGLFGDNTEAMVEQFRADVHAAGIDKITEDFMAQLAVYLGK